jgi:hypothetical protein
MPQLRLNTASAVGQHDDARLTGRSSARSTGSRPGSSGRRSESARARVSLSDQAFKGRAMGAVNMFPNPLFENSNASLAYTDRSHGAGRSDPGTPLARQHKGGAATRFSTSFDVGGKIAMEGRGWRSPERDLAVPSPRQIRMCGRGGRVQLPPSSYEKDVYAGAGEHAHPAAHGPYSAFGVLEPGIELKAGTRQDPISKQESVRQLYESGKITTSKHNCIRDTPQYRQAMYGTVFTVDHDYPNSWENLFLQPRSEPVQPVKTMVPPAGGYHPNLAVWGGMINGMPSDTTIHYHHHVQRMTEEERRSFLVSGERYRRHANKRLAITDPMGLGGGGWGGHTAASHPLSSSRRGSPDRGRGGGWGGNDCEGGAGDGGGRSPQEWEHMFRQIRIAENRTRGGGYGLSVGGAWGGWASGQPRNDE